MKTPRSLLLGVLALISAPAHGAESAARPHFPTRDLGAPTGPDSQCSNLTSGPDGTLYLTWSGPGANPGERSLRFATLAPSATRWTEPRTIVATPLLMENWADFASLVIGTDGALTAQWFQRAGAEARGYDGWFARSTDHGLTWSTPTRLGHEFVALAPLSGGRTLAVWLESTRAHDTHAAPRPKRDPNAPREARPARDPSAPYAPSMKLLARLLAPDGGNLGEWTVDPDVCTCCQNTVTTLPGDRVFVAYRGHTADEIRDNKFATFNLSAMAWTSPATLKDDGWKIPACPVNGPAADARDEALAVAWFTAAQGTPRVQARYSADAGRTFGTVVSVDLGKPMGRIETVMLADKSALCLWMEIGTDDKAAGIYARRLFPDGALSAAVLVADSAQERTSGFPRAAVRPDGQVVFSWTQTGASLQVRTLAFDPSPLGRSAGKTTGTPAVLRRNVAEVEFCIAPLAVAGHVPAP